MPRDNGTVLSLSLNPSLLPDAKPFASGCEEVGDGREGIERRARGRGRRGNGRKWQNRVEGICGGRITKINVSLIPSNRGGFIIVGSE